MITHKSLFFFAISVYLSREKVFFFLCVVHAYTIKSFIKEGEILRGKKLSLQVKKKRISRRYKKSSSALDCPSCVSGSRWSSERISSLKWNCKTLKEFKKWLCFLRERRRRVTHTYKYRKYIILKKKKKLVLTGRRRGAVLNFGNLALWRRIIALIQLDNQRKKQRQFIVLAAREKKCSYCARSNHQTLKKHTHTHWDTSNTDGGWTWNAAVDGRRCRL